MRCLVPLLMTANHLFIRPLYFCLLSVSGLDIQRKPRRPDDCVRGLNIHPWNMQVLSSLRISLLYNVTTPKYCACHGKKHCFTISLANTSPSSPSKAGMAFLSQGISRVVLYTSGSLVRANAQVGNILGRGKATCLGLWPCSDC